jgi:hypothetical protein
VNPGLEMVFLQYSQDGWQPEIAKAFPQPACSRSARSESTVQLAV